LMYRKVRTKAKNNQKRKRRQDSVFFLSIRYVVQKK
jgi:hypothetical protein